MNCQPRFRNDDVACDTSLEMFARFCDIFHKHGFSQVHAVTLHGLCNYAFQHDGSPCVYAGHPTLSLLDNQRIRELSRGHDFAQRADLVELVANGPDEVALHGLFHEDYAKMDEDEQYMVMQQGLDELQTLFPHKNIRFFVPPFNRRNKATYSAANRVGLRVLGDEGIHLEQSLTNLVLEPGVWYRYHHHRFYPTSTYGDPALTIGNLDDALAKAKEATGPLPIPSFDYEGDIRLLKELVTLHSAQPWYLQTAQNRLQRKELALAMGWVYAHIPHDRRIFEVGCGAGNNLMWLSQHGYNDIGGSDIDEKALKVAAGMAKSVAREWKLQTGSFLEPGHIPEKSDVILALNCTYLLEDFNLDHFIGGCTAQLSPDGCIVFDQIDASFNSKEQNRIYSPQWDLPRESQNKPSEYKHRISVASVGDIAEKHGMRIVAALPSLQRVPRCVYVLGKKNACYPSRRPMPVLRLPEELVQPTVQTIFLSGKFDWIWYREQYVHGPEMMDPLEHYVRFGASRGYWPNPEFDSGAYRSRHMDLLDPTNPLLHSLLRASGNI